jgi:hypothetical protein
VVLAVVLLAVVVWRLWPSGGAAPAARTSQRARVAAATDGDDRPNQRVRSRGRRGDDEPVREVAVLRVGQLEAAASGYEAGRNPFAFAAPPPPPPPVRREPPPPPPRREEPQVAAVPQGPQPPPLELTYLGSFGRQSLKIAVFTDGENIYNALLGDVLEHHFRLVKIGYESVELEYVDFPELPAQQLRVGAEGT